MRELKSAYKDAAAAVGFFQFGNLFANVLLQAGPIYYTGIFSASFDLIMNEHLNWLGDVEASSYAIPIIFPGYQEI